MWRIDVESLAASWSSADPFPFAVADDVLEASQIDELFAILEEEPVHYVESDLFAFDATSPEPTTDAFRTLRERFAAELAPVLTTITGTHVARADMRAFAYRPGHYLLPHTDHQEDLRRVLAYAYYLPSPDPAQGGELELYRCTLKDGELVQTDTAKLVEPRPNRLVVFEVSEVSLHQVREVLAGLRLSLAGWFYA
jgi:Rps23 Pro-64 3,4-dihydroxylase Tpa1-like proline 4-hydroxylase